MVLRAHGGALHPDPLVLLTGGPGIAASSATMQRYASAVFGALRDSRDVVLMDVRGTGGSHPLDCDLYRDGGRMQLYVAPMFPLERVRACAERLRGSADLTQYTTSATADDLDAVLGALGHATANLFGASYGSRLALDFMRRHPARVRSAVLVGVSPPEAPVSLAASWAGERTLERVLTECAADPACRAASPDARADLAAVTARLRAGPVTVRLWSWPRLSYETVTLTARGVAERLWGAAYDADMLRRELPLVHDAAAGRWAGLARRLVSEGRQRRGGRSEGLMLSVLCAEDAPRLAAAGAVQGGGALGAPVVEELVRACEVWPHGDAGARFAAPVTSDVPVLLISGELDPITPPELAKAARRTLPRAEEYVVARGGHAALDEGASGLLVDWVGR
jgi:pimeloyl-ACP methyl ester carboxylesterase